MATIRSNVSTKSTDRTLRNAGEHRALVGYAPELKTRAGEHEAFSAAGDFAAEPEREPTRAELLGINAKALWALFPDDWAPCPGCGLPALEGQTTCGYVGCKAVR